MRFWYYGGGMVAFRVGPLVLLSFVLFAGCRRQAVVSAKPADSGATISLTLTDVTLLSGIRFTHNNGAFGGKLLPETMGAGLAFLDYDGDGDQDLFLVNGRDWTEAEVAAFKNGSGRDMAASLPAQIPRKGGTCKLYQNNGDGTFTDVTRGSGIDIPLYGMGATVGDYDNDGRPD